MNRDTWSSVFQYLDLRTLCHLNCVCQEWHRILRHSYVWKQKAKELNLVSESIKDYYRLLKELSRPVAVKQLDEYSNWVKDFPWYNTWIVYRKMWYDGHDISIGFSYLGVTYTVYIRYKNDVQCLIVIEPIKNPIKYLAESWNLLRHLIYRHTQMADKIETWEKLVANKYVRQNNCLFRFKNEKDPHLLDWNSFQYSKDPAFLSILDGLARWFVKSSNPISILEILRREIKN